MKNSESEVERLKQLVTNNQTDNQTKSAEFDIIAEQLKKEKEELNVKLIDKNNDLSNMKKEYDAKIIEQTTKIEELKSLKDKSLNKLTKMIEDYEIRHKEMEENLSSVKKSAAEAEKKYQKVSDEFKAYKNNKAKS